VCTENPFHNCPDGATIHDVRAELDEATVTISDPIAPAEVVGVVPAGPQHGTVTFRVSAVDAAAGVASVDVVDGSGEVVGGPVDVPAGCDYSYVTPCPTVVTELPVAVDTTALANGEDSVRVVATNAASDSADSAPYALDVANEPAPTEGTETSGHEEASEPSGGHVVAQAGGGGAPPASNLLEEPRPALILSDPGGGVARDFRDARPLPPVAFHLQAPRAAGVLSGGAGSRPAMTIAGDVSVGATGFLTGALTSATEQGHTCQSAHARRDVRASAPIDRGHFRLRFPLPAAACAGSGWGLRGAHLRLRLYYAGNSRYRATHLTTAIRAPTG
jgi:hypothetical protein